MELTAQVGKRMVNLVMMMGVSNRCGLDPYSATCPLNILGQIIRPLLTFVFLPVEWAQRCQAGRITEGIRGTVCV